MEDNEDINNHLKNSLNEFLVQPRMTSFDEVIKKLERKRKRRFILLFFSGVLLLTLGTGLFYGLTKTVSTIAQNNEQEKTINETTNSSISTPNSKLDEPLAIKDPESSSITPSKKITSNKSLAETKKLTQKKQIPLEKKIKSAQHNEPTPTKPSSHNTATDSDDITKPSPVQEISFDTNNKHETIFADKLLPKKLVLPITQQNKNIVLDSLSNLELVLAKEDSAKKTKKVQFLLGLSYNPQFGTYHFSQNNGSSLDKEFSKAYLENKKEQTALKFNYSVGLKAGILIKDRWELLAGFNYQRYRQEETIKQLTIGGPGPTVSYLNNNSNFDSTLEGLEAEPAVLGKTYVSTYRYLDYSLELNRLFNFRSSMKLKAGLGLHLQQLALRKNSTMITAIYSDTYYYISGNNSSINKFLYSFDIKGGIIEDLTKRMQIQFCPNFFYSPKSMFKNFYVIKQKNYGLGLEVLFLFKIG